MDSKKELRTELKKRLSALSFYDLIERSEKLSGHFHRIFNQPLSKPARFVVSFHPFDEEPQINIEKETHDEPFEVAYVRIDDWNARKMSCRKARRDQPGDWEEVEMIPGVRIFQPNRTSIPCKNDEISAILVPGLGFTKTGERLGRGAGFYDRLLQECPHALRVGIAFQEQMVDKIPCESWDQKLDLVLTDQHIFETNPFREWQKQGKVLTRS